MFKKLQKIHRKWVDENFGDTPDPLTRSALHAVLGVAEEAGELCHAVLKTEQAIRGDAEEHAAELRDAVGDIVMFLLHFCSEMGWDFVDIVRQTAKRVHQRDWNEHPDDGGEVDETPFLEREPVEIHCDNCSAAFIIGPEVFEPDEPTRAIPKHRVNSGGLVETIERAVGPEVCDACGADDELEPLDGSRYQGRVAMLCSTCHRAINSKGPDYMPRTPRIVRGDKYANLPKFSGKTPECVAGKVWRYHSFGPKMLVGRFEAVETCEGSEVIPRYYTPVSPDDAEGDAAAIQVSTCDECDRHFDVSFLVEYGEVGGLELEGLLCRNCADDDPGDGETGDDEPGDDEPDGDGEKTSGSADETAAKMITKGTRIRHRIDDSLPVRRVYEIEWHGYEGIPHPEDEITISMGTLGTNEFVSDRRENWEPLDDFEDDVDEYERAVAGEYNERFRVLSYGALSIAQERQRQCEVHGYNSTFDDQHTDGELMAAALAYLAHAQGKGNFARDMWPFTDEDGRNNANWKPSEGKPIEDLERAGALIAAEIDRQIRLSNMGGEPDGETRPQIGCMAATGFVEPVEGDWTCSGCGAPVVDGVCSGGDDSDEETADEGGFHRGQPVDIVEKQTGSRTGPFYYLGGDPRSKATLWSPYDETTLDITFDRIRPTGCDEPEPFDESELPDRLQIEDEEDGLTCEWCGSSPSTFHTLELWTDETEDGERVAVGGHVRLCGDCVPPDGLLEIDECPNPKCQSTVFDFAGDAQANRRVDVETGDQGEIDLNFVDPTVKLHCVLCKRPTTPEELGVELKPEDIFGG